MPFIHADVMREAIPYLFPEIRRGPAYEHWLSTMKALGAELELEPCPHCANVPAGRLCGECRGTGYNWEMD